MYDFGRIESADVELVVPSIDVEKQIERDVPRYLYKYTRRMFAEDLACRGSLRLGSLFEYRDGEVHDAGLHDPHEGTLSATGRLPNGDCVGVQFYSRPKWMFCVSEHYNPKLLASFDETYDAIVRIEAKPFFNVMALALAAEANLAELRKVQYVSQGDLHFDPWPCDGYGRLMLPCAATIKSSFYSGQGEWRMTFEANTRMHPVGRNRVRPVTSDRHGVAAGFGVSPSFEKIIPLHAIKPKVPLVLPKLAEFGEIVYIADGRREEGR